MNIQILWHPDCPDCHVPLWFVGCSSLGTEFAVCPKCKVEYAYRRLDRSCPISGHRASAARRDDGSVWLECAVCDWSEEVPKEQLPVPGKFLLKQRESEMNLQFSGQASEEERQKVMQLRMTCVELAVRYMATLTSGHVDAETSLVEEAALIEDYVLNGADVTDEQLRGEN